jgi:hypothetical protein
VLTQKAFRKWFKEVWVLAWDFWILGNRFWFYFYRFKSEFKQVKVVGGRSRKAGICV